MIHPLFSSLVKWSYLLTGYKLNLEVKSKPTIYKKREKHVPSRLYVYDHLDQGAQTSGTRA